MRLGKDKHAIAIAVFLLLYASAWGQAGKSHKYQLDGNLQVTNVISGDQSLIINYSISELNLESFPNDNGSFYRISIPGHTRTVTPGKPELPVFSRLITIPEGSGYKIKITEVRSSKVKPSGKRIDGILFPSQDGETKSLQQRKPEFKIDRTVYASRKIISSDTVSIEFLGTARNTRLYNLIVSPVRYNPHTNVLEVIKSMKIEITFSDADNQEHKSLLPESDLFNESIEKGVLNFSKGDVIPGYTDNPVEMIIITDTAFRKHLEPFIKWKTQKGFNLKVLYIGTGLAGNTYLQLKDTLTRIYNASSPTNPPPEYLLIVGDINRVPSYGSGNITDMYYGEFTGNGDYIPEMYIGRLPVADTTELKTVVGKIIQYEKFEFADTNKFYTRAFATTGVQDDKSVYMNGQVKYAVTNYLTTSNGINEYHFYTAQSKLATAEDSILKILKKGVSFINYTGHGDAEGWLDPTIKTPQVALLENRNMYPFIISNACQTARFSSSASFGNRMVLTKEKGAIGFIGCSMDSYWDEDYFWAVGPGPITADPTYQTKGLGAYDRLFHTHEEAPSEWYFTMGQINYAGNLAVSASTSSMKKYYWETYNVIGDPSIIPIIGKPDTFNIALPDTLPNGIKSLSLNIDPFAYIAVSHFDTLWDASYANLSGSVILDMPGLSEDSCLIVITGQNKLPFIKTIYFSEVSTEFINLNSSSINDIEGNNNNRVDFGESFFLKLNIGNLGSTDATGLYAKLSTTSSWLSINTDSVFIGTLTAGSEILIPDKLRLTVSGNVPDLSSAILKLKLKDESVEKNYTIDILIHAPQLQIINCVMDDSVLGDGDHIADPGETFNLVFKIRNTGSSDISGQFTVTSPDTGITLLEPSVKSGILKFGEITDIPVMVKLSESLMSGSSVSISSTLDCTPYLINKDFSFRVGRIRESFEASSLSIFPWINLSQVPWTITESSAYDGSISARSGAVTHNGTTTLMIKTVFSSADSVKFYYKVSSETNYDFFSFKLNGTEVFKKSGEVPWTKKAIAVPAGLNKMEWIYKKDNSVTSGADCVWIDMIDFAVSSTVSYIQKDLHVAKIVAPVLKDKYSKNETVTVKVLNTGKDILNGFTLALEVNNQASPVKEFFENKVIPFGDTVTVSFKTKADMSKYGIYKFITYGTDNNDDYILNDTLRVNIENTRINETLSVFPNPFKDQLTIFLNAQATDKVTISITNVSGKILYELKKDVISGKNVIVIDNPGLIPSLYYLNIHGVIINKTIPILKITK